jgi:hypothetical protein
MTSLIRSTLIPAIVLALVGCNALTRHPGVRIGATQSEIRKVTSKYHATHPVGSEYEIIENRDPSLRIRAGFDKGICNRIKYISANHQKIADHTISLILSMNSNGVAWIVQKTPVTEGTVYLKSVDGKYRAVLTDKTELFVFTEALFQKTMREMDEEAQQSKAQACPRP